MKKKLVLLLAATLLVGTSAITTPTSAAINTNQIETNLKNDVIQYPNKLFIRGYDITNLPYHGAYIDFDTTDPNNKKLIVTDMLGDKYSFNPTMTPKNTHISIKLYTASGKLKKEVSLTGNDKLEKLNQINNTPFNYGDYLKFYIIEPRVLKIEGPVQNNQTPMTSVILNKYHYLITANGLQLVEDTKVPTTLSEVKESYWDENSFVLNSRFKFNEEKFGKNYTQNLLVKDKDGKVVKTINGTPVYWYSGDDNNFIIDKNNYNGSQFILNPTLLQSLEEGTYSFSMSLLKDGSEIAAIDLVQNEINNSFNKYKVYTNVNDTGSMKFGGKTYTFKTENNRTGKVLLNVKKTIKN